MSNEVKTMVLGWLNGKTDDHAVEQTAKFMRDTLRLGSITECRKLVKEALS